MFGAPIMDVSFCEVLLEKEKESLALIGFFLGGTQSPREVNYPDKIQIGLDHAISPSAWVIRI